MGGIKEDLEMWILLKIIVGECLGAEKSKMIDLTWIKAVFMTTRNHWLLKDVVWKMPRKRHPASTNMASLLRILNIGFYFDSMDTCWTAIMFLLIWGLEWSIPTFEMGVYPPAHKAQCFLCFQIIMPFSHFSFCPHSPLALNLKSPVHAFYTKC